MYTDAERTAQLARLASAAERTQAAIGHSLADWREACRELTLQTRTAQAMLEDTHA